MLDTVHVRFPCKHRPLGFLRFLDENHKPEGEYSRRKLLSGAFGATRCAVKSCRGGMELSFQGSPAKFLQGHNLVGSNDLVGLLCVLFERLTITLGIQVEADDREKWYAGDFHLTRVDWAITFALANEACVTNALAHIERRVRAAGTPCAVYSSKGIETVMIRPHARRTTLVFYDKASEIRHNRAQLQKVPQASQLSDFAKGFLRIELRLHATYLNSAVNDLGAPLRIGSSWSSSFAKKLLFGQLEQLNLEIPCRNQLPDAVKKKLPRRLARVYCAWLSGNDLLELYSAATLARARQELLPFGIDISTSNASTPATTWRLQPPARLATVTVPQWIKDAGLLTSPFRGT